MTPKAKEHVMSEHPPVAVATDSVLTINFYSATPLLILGCRAHEPFQDSFVFPGGHFDPGIWNESQSKYVVDPNSDVPCDPSLRGRTSRETREEINVAIHSSKWQFLTELDAPDRDPRTDMRRISIAFWKDLDHQPMSLAAGDDLASFTVVNLMTLEETDMGFDHWKAVQILQQRWREYSQIWSKDVDENWRHACPTLKKLSSNGDQNPWMHAWINQVIYANPRPQIVILSEGSEYILPGKTRFCPYCGVDLLLPPPT